MGPCSLASHFHDHAFIENNNKRLALCKYDFQALNFNFKLQYLSINSTSEFKKKIH